jgi:hypothetical protein
MRNGNEQKKKNNSTYLGRIYRGPSPPEWLHRAHTHGWLPGAWVPHRLHTHSRALVSPPYRPHLSAEASPSSPPTERCRAPRSPRRDSRNRLRARHRYMDCISARIKRRTTTTFAHLAASLRTRVTPAAGDVRSEGREFATAARLGTIAWSGSFSVAAESRRLWWH